MKDYFHQIIARTNDITLDVESSSRYVSPSLPVINNEDVENPFEEGSTRVRIRKDPGKKISTEDTKDAEDEGQSVLYPGYVKEDN